MDQQLSLGNLQCQNGSRSMPFSRLQLLKWVGNKQRFAHEIIGTFPVKYNTYFEPFLGSGAVLGALAPRRAVASDVCTPLLGIWHLLHSDPVRLAMSYRTRWEEFTVARRSTYEAIKTQFNHTKCPEDLFFLSRTCYAGIIRFRKDGYMSTPIGPHKPVSPESVADRISIWNERTKHTEFMSCDFEESMERAECGDLIYCDPPYTDTQSILYGSQEFSLERLFGAIDRAKCRGVYVVLSIDGKKKSGRKHVNVNAPTGLFETEFSINCGRSMLRRLQMEGKTLEAEVVSDRLLLTWNRNGS